MIIQIEPWIGDEELNEITEVIKSTYLTESKKTEQLESKFKELTGAENAIAYSNGSTALFGALKILGIGPGDEVIVPALTYIASSNSIILSGAKPIFVDVDRDTAQIDPKEIEKNITPRTKAIMPVHLYGQSCDMDFITFIANKYKLKVIEDAAQGVGVKFKGKHVGLFGDIGAFSFYGNKTITMGEGGMVITANSEFNKKLRAFKNHGRYKRGTFLHEEIGYNFSITEMQAAIGIAQLGKFEKIKKRKDEIRLFYEKYLADIQEIKLTYIDPRCSPVHWFTSILVPNVPALQEHLAKNEIQTRRFFPVLNMQPCYKEIEFQGEYPNATYLYEHGVSLPSSAILKDEQLEEVVKRIREFYKK
ncbi:MAG: DegT/DnrJ/EryC1/StrS family aminotransferase [Nanoarchaeota archaeon]|nr:DegT/DnrJ/EryC1/StrS family aminotransferase [Nanoarchaeota archaeon]